VAAKLRKHPNLKEKHHHTGTNRCKQGLRERLPIVTSFTDVQYRYRYLYSKDIRYSIVPGTCSGSTDEMMQGVYWEYGARVLENKCSMKHKAVVLLVL
jgi:hypothetical protein